jgi:hypothetical protein
MPDPIDHLRKVEGAPKEKIGDKERQLSAFDVLKKVDEPLRGQILYEQLKRGREMGAILADPNGILNRDWGKTKDDVSQSSARITQAVNYYMLARTKLLSDASKEKEVLTADRLMAAELVNDEGINAWIETIEQYEKLKSGYVKRFGALSGKLLQNDADRNTAVKSLVSTLERRNIVSQIRHNFLSFVTSNQEAIAKPAALDMKRAADTLLQNDPRAKSVAEVCSIKVGDKLQKLADLLADLTDPTRPNKEQIQKDIDQSLREFDKIFDAYEMQLGKDMESTLWVPMAPQSRAMRPHRDFEELFQEYNNRLGKEEVAAHKPKNPDEQLTKELKEERGRLVDISLEFRKSLGQRRTNINRILVGEGHADLPHPFDAPGELHIRLPELSPEFIQDMEKMRQESLQYTKTYIAEFRRKVLTGQWTLPEMVDHWLIGSRGAVDFAEMERKVKKREQKVIDDDAAWEKAIISGKVDVPLLGEFKVFDEFEIYSGLDFPHTKFVTDLFRDKNKKQRLLEKLAASLDLPPDYFKKKPEEQRQMLAECPKLKSLLNIIDNQQQIMLGPLLDAMDADAELLIEATDPKNDMMVKTSQLARARAEKPAWWSDAEQEDIALASELQPLILQKNSGRPDVMEKFGDMKDLQQLPVWWTQARGNKERPSAAIIREKIRDSSLQETLQVYNALLQRIKVRSGVTSNAIRQALTLQKFPNLAEEDKFKKEAKWIYERLLRREDDLEQLFEFQHMTFRRAVDRNMDTHFKLADWEGKLEPGWREWLLFYCKYGPVAATGTYTLGKIAQMRPWSPTAWLSHVANARTTLTTWRGFWNAVKPGGYTRVLAFPVTYPIELPYQLRNAPRNIRNFREWWTLKPEALKNFRTNLGLSMTERMGLARDLVKDPTWSKAPALEGVVKEVHEFKLNELNAKYADLDAAKAELKALEEAPKKDPTKIAEVKFRMKNVQRDIYKIVIEKRDMILTRCGKGFPRADANRLVRSGVCGAESMDDLLKTLQKSGLMVDELDNLVKIPGLQKLGAGANVMEAVNDLAKSGHLTPEAAANIAKSKSAQNLFRGALELEDEAVRATEVSRLARAARGASMSTRLMGALSLGAEAFGAAMAIYEYIQLDEKIEQTQNPELKKLYEGRQKLVVVQGGVSMSVLIIQGVVCYMYGSAAMLAASGPLILPALGLAGVVYVSGKFDEVSEGWLRNEKDYESWPEELLMKKLCEKENQSFWAQLGMVLAESDYGVDAWFTSKEKAAEIAEKIATADKGEAFTALRAYLKKDARCVIQRKEGESDADYAGREMIFVADAALFLSRHASAAKITGQDLENAREHARLCAYSRDLNEQKRSDKIQVGRSEGGKIIQEEFDLAEYLNGARVYHSKTIQPHQIHGRIAGRTVLAAFMKNEREKIAADLEQLRFQSDSPGGYEMALKAAQTYLLGKLKPYMDRFSGRANFHHEDENDLDMVRSSMSEMIRHRLYWETKALFDQKREITGKDLEDILSRMSAMLLPKQDDDDGEFKELMKFAQGSSLIYGNQDKHYTRWLEANGATPDAIKGDKHKSYILHPQYLAANLIVSQRQDRTQEFGASFLPDIVKAQPFEHRGKLSYLNDLIGKIEPRLVYGRGASVLRFAFYEDYRLFKIFADRLRISPSPDVDARAVEGALIAAIDNLDKFNWNRGYWINDDHVGDRTNAAIAVTDRLYAYRRYLSANERMVDPIDVEKSKPERDISGYDKFLTSDPYIRIYMLENGKKNDAATIDLSRETMFAGGTKTSEKTWEKRIPGLGVVKLETSDESCWWYLNAETSKPYQNIVVTARRQVARGDVVDQVAWAYHFDAPKEKVYDVKSGAVRFLMKMSDFELSENRRYLMAPLTVTITKPDGTVLRGRLSRGSEYRRNVPFFTLEEITKPGSPTERIDPKEGLARGMELFSAQYFGNEDVKVQVMPGPLLAGSVFEFMDQTKQKQIFKLAQPGKEKVISLTPKSMEKILLSRGDLGGDLKFVNAFATIEGTQLDMQLADGRKLRGVVTMHILPKGTTNERGIPNVDLRFLLRNVQVKEVGSHQYVHILSSSMKALSEDAVKISFVDITNLKTDGYRIETAGIGVPLEKMTLTHPTSGRIVEIVAKSAAGPTAPTAAPVAPKQTEYEYDTVRSTLRDNVAFPYRATDFTMSITVLQDGERKLLTGKVTLEPLSVPDALQEYMDVTRVDDPSNPGKQCWRIEPKEVATPVEQCTVTDAKRGKTSRVRYEQKK